MVYRSLDPDVVPQVDLVVDQYNRSRGFQGDLVKAMSTMMRRNVCLSGSHPLLAAIDAHRLDVTSLSQGYNPLDSSKSDLRDAEFDGRGIKIYILNGRQRVSAARQAYYYLGKKERALKGHITDLEGEVNGYGEGVVTAPERRARIKLRQTQDDLKVLQETIHNVEFWPIHFYDKGQTAPYQEGE